MYMIHQFLNNKVIHHHTRSLAAVRDDTGPSAFLTTQLPRLSWRVTTDDDLVIFSFDPRIIRWNQVSATFRCKKY